MDESIKTPYNEPTGNLTFNGDYATFGAALNNDNVRRKLYDELAKNNHFQSDYAMFEIALNNDNVRRKLYDELASPLASAQEKRRGIEQEVSDMEKNLHPIERNTWTKLARNMFFPGYAPASAGFAPIHKNFDKDEIISNKLSQALTSAERDALGEHYKAEEQRLRKMAEEEDKRLKDIHRKNLEAYDELPWYAKIGGPSYAINTHAADRMNAADPEYRMTEDIIRNLDTSADTYAAPTTFGDEWWITNFGRGIGNVVSDADFLTRGLTEARRQLTELGVKDKMNRILEDAEREGWDEKTLSDKMYDALTDTERRLYASTMELMAAQAARSADTSLGYQAGQALAESAGYMLDFYLSGKLLNASPAFRNMTARALRSLHGRIAKDGGKALSALSRAEKAAYGAGKFGIRAADASAQTALRTAMFPSTYNEVLDNRLEVDEKGRYVNSWASSLANGYTDSFLENLSEMSGPMMTRLLKFGGQGAKATAKFIASPVLKSKPVRKATEAYARKIRETGLSAAAREKKVLADALAKAGYYGPVEEYMEEVFNAVMMTAKGYITGNEEDKRQFGQFWTFDSNAVLVPTVMLPGVVTSTYNLIANREAIRAQRQKEKTYSLYPWLRNSDEVNRWNAHELRRKVNASTVPDGQDLSQGRIQQVQLTDGRTVYVTQGQLAFNMDNTIDADNSADGVTVMDAKGRKSVVSTKGNGIRVEKLLSDMPYNTERLYQERLTNREAEARYNYSVGKEVRFSDPNTGELKTNPDGTPSTGTIIGIGDGVVRIDTHDPSLSDPVMVVSYTDLDAGKWLVPNRDGAEIKMPEGGAYSFTVRNDNGTTTRITVEGVNSDGTAIASLRDKDGNFKGRETMTRAMIEWLEERKVQDTQEQEQQQPVTTEERQPQAREQAGTDTRQRPQPNTTRTIDATANANPRMAGDTNGAYIVVTHEGHDYTVQPMRYNPDGTVTVRTYDTATGNILQDDTMTLQDFDALRAQAKEVHGTFDTQTENPEPTGKGRFGNIYQWTTGKAKEAADFLRRMQSGYLKGVFHRNDIGDIDLVWGNDKGGLKHIIQKHIVEHDDFDSVEEAMQIIDDVLANGEPIPQGSNLSFDYNGYRVSVAKSEDGNWVLTAFDKSRTENEKKRNSQQPLVLSLSTTDTSDGAAQGVSAQTAGISTNKDTQSSQTTQDPVQEIADGTVSLMGSVQAAQKAVAHTVAEAQKKLAEVDRKIEAAEVVLTDPKSVKRYKDLQAQAQQLRQTIDTYTAAMERLAQPQAQPQGEAGGQGSPRDVAIGEQDTQGTAPSDSGRGTEGDGGTRGTDTKHPLSQEDTQSGQEVSPTLINPLSMPEQERQRRGNMLRNAPAIDIATRQIVSTPELSARKAAEKWWENNVPEPVFYDTEAGQVEINKKSVETSLAHRYGQAKLDAITSLVDGFKHAVYLGTLPDGRERGVVDHYFAYPINYNGKRCYVFCRAMQDANKNRLYVHEVFVADNIKMGDTLQTAASKPHGGIALYKDILSNVLEITPEQSALLKRPNFAQYPTEEELSTDKDTKSPANAQDPSQETVKDERQIDNLRADLSKKIDKLWPFVNFLNEQYGYDFYSEHAFVKWITKRYDSLNGIHNWIRDKIPPESVWDAMKAIKEYVEAYRKLAEGEKRQKSEKAKAISSADGGRGTEGDGRILKDNQGNLTDENGKLVTERIDNIDQLTDEDFTNPYRSVQLPTIPKSVSDAIGANGRPVIIKKNIFEKNKRAHADLSPDESREILISSLYSPNLYGQNQKSKRPYNWVVINTKDSNGKNRLVLLEVARSKDFVEVVHWHFLKDKSLETLKRQAEKEGGLILMLPSDSSEEAGGLSSRQSGSSADKDTKNPETTQQITDAVEKLGLGVEIITSPSQLPKEEKKAREAIEKGAEVKGWYNAKTGKAYLYLPNAEDAADAVETVLHEVVAHKGLRGLLGKEGFDRLCDEVWDMMDAGQRRRFMAYVTRKRKMTETEFLAAVADGNKRRKAADEYIAHLAESLDTEKLANESAWKRVLEAVRAFLGRMGIGRDANISDESITRLLQDSYRQLRRQKEGGNTENIIKENISKAEAEVNVTPTEAQDSSVNKQKQEEKDIKRPAAKIEDVGEKIGGARKDKVKEFAEKEKRVRENKEDVLAEIAQLPVSKMFNFDYDALRKEGVSNEIVTLLQVIKSAIPSKPRTPYKLRRWVSDVFGLYHVALKLITLEETGQKKIVERLKGMDVIGQRYTARMALGGYDGGFELGDARLEELGETAGHYDKEGNWVSVKGQWYVTGAGRYDGIYGTKEKAIEALRDFAGLQRKNKGDRKVEFSIYKNRATGKAFITVKGKPQIIVESGFENASDARRYLQEHYDDLVRSWSNMKTQTTIGFKEQKPRKGKDWRAGRDVSADEFRATFGFRGVEFGNWANQQERQIALNNAYDALMDLSEATGKSPRAISLNGELGIAFGARGSGRAMAHYEPDKIVINLTKTMGAGTLAHEWWHAMDNYFARMRGQRHKYNTDRTGYSYDRTRGTYSDEERREITDAFKELNTAIELSGYGERSKKYASLKSSYWSRPTELGARAFEAWVNRKLSEKGTINDFLATPPMAWENNGLTETYYPYPIESDFEKLDTAFENLFDTMQEKVDEETGNSALFRIADPATDLPLTEQEAALRDALAERLQEAGIEVVTDSHAAQQMLDEANGNVKLNAKKKKAPETDSVPDEELQRTAISSANGAKILKNLDDLIDRYEKNQETKEKTFLGTVAAALGINMPDKSSKYATFEAMNGKVFSLRLSNHNAKVSNFDNYGESEGISIVISSQKNKGAVNDGNAHVVEFFYNAIKLRRADGKPLVEILKSIKQALYSGEYMDTTGLADVKEANPATPIHYHRAYHGSGAEFSAFDHSHMGEGEGAQAYGWGSYVTEVKGIGRTYAESQRKTPDDIDDIVKSGMDEWDSDTDNVIETDDETRERFGVYEPVYLEDKYRIGDADEKELALAAAEYYGEEIDMADEDAVYGMTERLLDDMTEYYNDRMAEKRDEYENDLRNSLSSDVFLYTVEIPDNTGSNYLEWEKPLTEAINKDDISKRTYELASSGNFQDEVEREILERDIRDSIEDSKNGKDLYKAISLYIGDKETSMLLHDIGFSGISYPAQFTTGGRSDNARNYVIFNEKDLKITDHVKFFRTPQGEAYGFTANGKIYIDTRIATADTPIHEYTHLWADALRRGNRQEWDSIVDMLRGTPQWNETEQRYPELTTDDRIAEETLALYSGMRGAQRLREQQQKIASEARSIRETVTDMGAIARVKQALKRFWKNVAGFLHLHYESVDEVADKVLADMLDGVNPLAMVRQERKRINDRFNQELRQQIDGTLPAGHVYKLGMPSPILQSTGIPDLPIELSAKRLQEKSEQRNHEFTITDVANLPEALRNPIAVFEYGDKNKAQNIIVELQKNGKNFLVGLHLNQSQRGLEVNSIRGLFPKDTAEWLNWISQDKALYLDKEKIQDLISQQRTNLADVKYLDLDSIANIINNFENPTIEDDIISFQKAAEEETENLRQQVNNATYDNAVGDSEVPVMPKPGRKTTLSDYLKTLSAWNEAMERRNDELIRGFKDEFAKNMKLHRQLYRKFVDAARPLENFQNFVVKNGGTLRPQSDAYGDLFASNGRATYKTIQFENGKWKPLEKLIKDMARNINLKSIDMTLTTEKNGKTIRKKAIPYDIISLYLRAKDILEAQSLGMVERGSTGFAEVTGMAPAEFAEMVESIFTQQEIDNLWRNIKDCTSFSLDMYNREGMLSDEKYDEFMRRGFYVPQRGWEQGQDEYEYDYDGMVRGSRFTNPLTKAEGRRSLASDPLKYIYSMATSSILATERNAVKRKFLQFIRDNISLGIESRAFDLKQVWFVKSRSTDPETGLPLYTRTYVQPSDELLEEDRKSYLKIDELKKQLSNETDPEAAAGIRRQITELRDNMNVVRSTRARKNTEDGVIRVVENGVEYEIRLNAREVSNTRGIVEVLERRSKKTNAVLRWFGRWTRKLTSMLTQYNPAFALANFVRDYLSAFVTNTVQYGFGFSVKAASNTIKVMRAVARHAVNGDYGGNGEYSGMLREFFENGGATGFTFLRDIGELEKDLRAEIGRGRLMDSVVDNYGRLKKGLAVLTEISEVSVRFGEYVTSRKQGKTIEESVRDAKEVTTNFDRKGSSIGIFSPFFGFLNASIQGNNRMFRLILDKHGKKLAAACMGFMVLGIVNTLLNPDDPDEGVSLTDYDRMSNLTIGNFKIPLPHFFRGFWGFGVQLALWMQGMKNADEFLLQGLQFLTGELVPEQLGILDGLRYDDASGRISLDPVMPLINIMPTVLQPLFEAGFNRDFTGGRIYKENYLRSMDPKIPKTQLGRDDESPALRYLTDWLANVSGGSATARTNRDIPFWADVNPSALAHVIEGYSPGILGLGLMVGSVAVSQITGEEYSLGNYNLVGRFYRPYDEGRTQERLYWKLKKKADRFKYDADEYFKAKNAGDGNAARLYEDMTTEEKANAYYSARQLLDDLNPDNEGYMPSAEGIRKLQEQTKEWNKIIE